MKVQQPPSKNQVVRLPCDSGPNINISECPKEFAGVEDATVKKLHPSK